MKSSRLSSLLALGLAFMAPALSASSFRDWAPTPPMGWNSWDCFGTTVTEGQTREQADFMAAKLASHGWQYIVVDIQWYEPGSQGHDYRAGVELAMDGNGRLQPAVNRFPSAADGRGFRPLADYVHSKGLKFGIHLMRGVPRKAVERKLPILGTPYTVADIADTVHTCPWNPDMYGVDMTKPGAQAYYDSVFALIASWGVDYVKVDDLSRPYFQNQPEIEAIRRAIDNTRRPMLLSMSPGATALAAADHAREHANLWRISDDFWDRWLALRDQFARLEAWNSHRVSGAWPDADMLPLGSLVMGKRATRFTRDEQFTLMSLWSIARSPLMHGGDMTRTDDFTLSLLTNDEVLAVNQASVNNRPVFNRDGLVAWTAEVPGSKDRYLAVFNTRDRVALKAANASFDSGVVENASADGAPFDVDLKGGSRLFLVADPAVASDSWPHVLWKAPVLLMADGSERPLTDEAWTSSDALWDSGSLRKDAAGKVVGIQTQASAVIEYRIPAGALRLRGAAVLENKGGVPVPARFLVVVATEANEDRRAGLPVEVSLAELGLSGEVSVRDLWTHAGLGRVSGSFAPEVPFHGARLFRLTPAP
jgi:hypothetical protein